MQIGTAHFTSRIAAYKYYAVYGYNHNDVNKKINDSEIFIGKPIVNENEKIHIDDDGRYFIITK